MQKNGWSRLSASSLIKIIVIGAILGALAALVTSTLDISLAITVSIAAGTTGVIAATLLRSSKPRDE